MTATTLSGPASPSVLERLSSLAASRLMMLYALVGVASMSLARLISDNDDLTSSGTFVTISASTTCHCRCERWNTTLSPSLTLRTPSPTCSTTPIML